MKRPHAFVLLVFLVFSAAQAWDSAGHQWLASKVCRDFNCNGCLTDQGAIAPDREFRDTVNHHCYNTSLPCPVGNWTCPQEDDCPALEKAEEWMMNATSQTGCERWYSLAVASHYFFDSKVFWHRVQKEESKCHSGFEKDAGKKFGNPGDWQVSRCGVSMSSSEVPPWILEFEGKLKAAGIEPEPASGNMDLIAIVAVAMLAAAILVFQKLKRR